MDEQERRGQFREHVPGGSIFVSRGGSILASVEALSEKGPRGALSVDLLSRFFTLGKALDFVRYPQEMVFEPDEASFCFG